MNSPEPTSSVPRPNGPPPSNARYRQLVGEAKTRVQEITVDELAELSPDSPPWVIDVRDAHEFLAGHLPGALHLSRGLLEGSIEETVPDVHMPLILYCAGGNRSALSADNLQRMGYTNVRSLAGGFGAWLNAGKPVEKPA